MDQSNSVAGPSQPAPGTVDPEELEMNGQAVEPQMSKSAMKKAARKAKEAELRPLKRAAEKERKKERLEQQRRAYAAGDMSEEQKLIFDNQRKLKAKRAALRKKTVEGKDGPAGTWKGGVVMDMGFDELMTEKEISSIHSQLSYCYSLNRAAAKPVSAVLHTSLNGNLRARMEGQGGSHGIHRKWSRCHWWEAGLEELQTRVGKVANEAERDVQAESVAAIQAATAARREDGFTDVCPFPSTHKLVYLSADSPNELTELSENDIYIVGGIVDKNRHKNLCQNKAERLGIETARLPIGTFMADLPTRKVLTVNHVFEILVQYIEKRDWKQAFDTVMPMRKLRQADESKRAKRKLSRKALPDGQVAEDDDDDNEDEDEDVEADEDEAEIDEEERPRKKSRDEDRTSDELQE